MKRSGRLRTCVLLCGSLGASALTLQAQATGDQQRPIDGVLRSEAALNTNDVRQRCPSAVARAMRELDDGAARVLDVSCRVTGTAALPTADGQKWLSATYEARRIEALDADSSSLARRDTVTLVGAALFTSLPRDSAWRPAWHGEVEHEYIASVTPTLAARPDGSVLVSVRYCWNGTGGCWQEFLRRHRGAWSAIRQVYRDQLPAIPDGTIGKGRGVDVKTLEGSFGVYSRNDGNCCPSREVRLSLALRGDSLVLRRFRVARVD